MKYTDDTLIVEKYVKALSEDIDSFDPDFSDETDNEYIPQITHPVPGDLRAHPSHVAGEELAYVKDKEDWLEAVYKDITETMPQNEWFKVSEWIDRSPNIEDIKKSYKRIYKTYWDFFHYPDRMKKIMYRFVRFHSMQRKAEHDKMYYKWTQAPTLTPAEHK